MPPRGLIASIIVSFLLHVTHASLLEWGDSDRKRPSVYHQEIRVNRRETTQIQDFDPNGDVKVSFPGSRRRSKVLGSVSLVNRVKLWPPWPLSLWQRQGDNNNSRSSSNNNNNVENPRNKVVTASNTYPSAAVVALVWCTQRARIGVRQLQEVGSSLWFHLPPALPPLLLLASIPQRVDGRTVIPLFRDPLARTLVLGGFGVAVLSWAHQEVHRKRHLTPLGVPQSVSRVFLPPFLPEMVPEPEIEALQQTNKQSRVRSTKNTDDYVDNNNDEEQDEENTMFSLRTPRLRKHLSGIYESTSMIGNRYYRRGGFWKERKRKRDLRRREAAKLRRMTIFDELVALQAIKRNARVFKNTKDELPLGFALVTGASQGIGRALAVELARWEIPLVLVARDLDRLISLAYDLEACYGVRCCVLQADLSEVDAAERIHETTTKAGLTIDILVNNAGIAYEGLSTHIDTALMERMIMINTMSFAKLSKLYGQDMIHRGRGRMLMVSSMAGMTTASPNTALYGATKAFEKSLSFSMSKELEPYGVGVTCLMPGPVTDTQFRDRSGTGRALCWYIPFYPRPAETVAHLGIMSLLDGDTQALPGWQNRAFIQLIRPILPQRVETMCVQAAWTPFQFPSWRRGKQQPPPPRPKEGLVDTKPPPSVHLDLKPRYNLQMPPLLLQLPVPEVVPSSPSPEIDPSMTAESAENINDVSKHEGETHSEVYESTTKTSTPSTKDITSSENTKTATSRPLAITSIESKEAHSGAGKEAMQSPPLKEGGAYSPTFPPTKPSQMSETLKPAAEENNFHGGKQEPSSSTFSETRNTPQQPKQNQKQKQDHYLNDPMELEDKTGDDNFRFDGSLSPRLGPIDLFHERHDAYILPKYRYQEKTTATPAGTVEI